MSFNPEQPVEYTHDTGTSQSGWFRWPRNNQTGSPRVMRPGHFDARFRALFAAMAAVGGISVAVAVIVYPDILDTTLSDVA